MKTAKKYLYLLNDVTNLLLRKERLDWEAKYRHLLQIFLFTVGLLIISIILNIYHYVRR